MGWGQEASPDLFHMPCPWQGCRAASQPRCTSATGKLRGTCRITQRVLPELLPTETQPALGIHTLGAPGEGRERVTKSQAAADTCHRKRRAAAGREPGGVTAIEPSAAGLAEPPLAGSGTPATAGTGHLPAWEWPQSPSGERESTSSAGWVSEASLSRVEHLKRLFLI